MSSKKKLKRRRSAGKGYGDDLLRILQFNRERGVVERLGVDEAKGVAKKSVGARLLWHITCKNVGLKFDPKVARQIFSRQNKKFALMKSMRFQNGQLWKNLKINSWGHFGDWNMFSGCRHGLRRMGEWEQSMVIFCGTDDRRRIQCFKNAWTLNFN